MVKMKVQFLPFCGICAVQMAISNLRYINRDSLDIKSNKRVAAIRAATLLLLFDLFVNHLGLPYMVNS